MIEDQEIEEQKVEEQEIEEQVVKKQKAEEQEIEEQVGRNRRLMYGCVFLPLSILGPLIFAILISLILFL